MLQELDSPLRTDQQVLLQPASVPEQNIDGPEVLGDLPDDIDWVMAPPPSAGQVRRRRLLRGGGPKGLRPRLRGQDALALLNAGPDAMLAVDVENRAILFSQAAQRLFGYSRTEILGRSADLLVAPASRGVLALLRQHIVEGARPGPGGGTVEVVGLRQDGTGFPAAVWLARVDSRQGAIVAVTFRDTSAQRAGDVRAEAVAAQLQHSQDMITAVLRAMSDRAIVITDAGGRITAVNRGTRRLLGYRASELIGKSTLCLYDPDDVAVAVSELGLQPGLDPLLEITRSGLPNLQEWAYLAKDGRRCPVSLKIIAIGDRRDPSGFACVANDLTLGWQPISAASTASERFLQELDDAPTRTLRWQVGGSGCPRRR